MRPRRKKAKYDWTPLLLAAIAVNLGLALFYSPLTAVTKARVEGVKPNDMVGVKAVLKSIEGKPALQINGNNLSSLMLYNTAFDSVKFEANPFGRAVITVTYRKAVGRLSGVPGTYLADDGTIFKSSEVLTGLPLIQIGQPSRELDGTIVGRIPTSALAYLAQELPTIADGENGTVLYADDGGLNLVLGGAEIKLGQAVQLEAKLTSLRKLMDADPELLSKVLVLNLYAPDKPAARFRKPSN